MDLVSKPAHAVAYSSCTVQLSGFICVHSLHRAELREDRASILSTNPLTHVTKREYYQHCLVLSAPQTTCCPTSYIVFMYIANFRSTLSGLCSHGETVTRQNTDTGSHAHGTRTPTNRRRADESTSRRRIAKLSSCRALKSPREPQEKPVRNGT